MDAAALDELANRFFGAIEDGDVATVGALYHPDVVVWHNYDQVEQPRDANLAVLGWLIANVTDRRYDEIQRVLLVDGFVQQHVLRGNAAGGPLEVPAMMRVHVADGLISRIDEYLDTGQLGVLRA